MQVVCSTLDYTASLYWTQPVGSCVLALCHAGEEHNIPPTVESVYTALRQVGAETVLCGGRRLVDTVLSISSRVSYCDTLLMPYLCLNVL